MIYCENYEYEFFEYYVCYYFSLEAVFQDVGKNNPTKNELDAEIQATLMHMPTYTYSLL